MSGRERESESERVDDASKRVDGSMPEEDHGLRAIIYERGSLKLLDQRVIPYEVSHVPSERRDGSSILFE